MGLVHVLDIRLKQASVRTVLPLTTYRILWDGVETIAVLYFSFLYVPTACAHSNFRGSCETTRRASKIK